MNPEQEAINKERFEQIVKLSIAMYLDGCESLYTPIYSMFGIDFSKSYDYAENPEYAKFDRFFIPLLNPYYEAERKFSAAMDFVDEGSKEEKSIVRKWEKQRKAIIDEIAAQVIAAYPNTWK